ncbi:hypothetical protein Hdeb2414_s0006g00211241 [Helianthus debilis subsp. tardiflorus]
MVRERTDWEKYRKRLLKQVQDFEKMKSAFAEEKAAFEAERNSEEWGREGLNSKLHAAGELLSKEQAEWKEVCKKDNQHMYVVCSKITDLEAQVATLKGKVEEVEADNEHLEAELKAQVASKDKDLAAKDVEIVEITNSIMNATEMDEVVVALIDASRAVGHRGGYLECARHVGEAFGQPFDTDHCSVTDQANSVLSRAKEVYDHLSLPVMELVTEALKHDDWSA